MRARLTSGHRLLGVDVARSVALVGMMSVHIFPSEQPDGSLHPSYVVAAGRAAALFAVLAGVGLALASGGHQPYGGARLRAVRAGVVARAAVLVALGLLLGQVDSPPLVILAYYGLLFVVAVPFLGLRAAPLGALAAGCAVVAPVVSQLWRSAVTPTPIAEPGGRDLLKELFLTGTYPVLTWTTYLFVGLAVGRCDLRRAGTAVALLAGGAVTAVGAKVLSGALVGAAGGVNALAEPLPPGSLFATDTSRWLEHGLFGTTPTESWRWLLVAAPHSGASLDLVHTCGTSAAVLGLSLLLARAGPRLLVLVLAATGSMTLTLYTCHVLALADGSPLRVSDDPMRLWLLQVAVAVVVATVWRALVGRGPLEALAAAADRAARRLVRPRARVPAG